MLPISTAVESRRPRLDVDHPDQHRFSAEPLRGRLVGVTSFRGLRDNEYASVIT